MIASRLTLRTFADQFYFPQKDLKDSTLKTIRHSLNRWERLTDDPCIQDIDKATMVEYTLACADGAKATQNKHRMVVKRLLRWAMELEILDSVPKIKKIRLPRPQPTAPTLEELGKLYRQANVAIWPVVPNCSTAQWWRAWIVASYFSAARLGDMKHSLLWSNVEADWLTYTARKTGIFHHVPLHPVLSHHLERLRRRNVKDDRLFYVAPKMTVDHLIRRELFAMSDAAGIPKVTPKLFRNASITEWSIAHRDAGRLIHGCGLGDMRDHYAVQRRIIGAALKNFAVPKEFNR